MKNVCLLGVLFLTCIAMQGQTIADFEDFNLSSGQFINDGNGSFQSGNVILPNNYNSVYDAWSGWAISATTDTLTPGFNNQYSSSTGTGANNSLSYAVSYAFDGVALKYNMDEATGFAGIYLANSTIAKLSMLNGDGFAKKFGGVTGNDPDFFRLKIRKFEDGQLKPDSITIYLADYRSPDNSADYILEGWVYVDLTSLMPADSLWFTLSSSDEGQYGMNTPAYFCADDIITTDIITATQERQHKNKTKLHPNPASQIIQFEGNSWGGTFAIYNAQGTRCKSGLLQAENTAVYIGDLPNGYYVFQGTAYDGQHRIHPFVKQ